jgi:hypothetical protein
MGNKKLVIWAQLKIFVNVNSKIKIYILGYCIYRPPILNQIRKTSGLMWGETKSTRLLFKKGIKRKERLYRSRRTKGMRNRWREKVIPFLDQAWKAKKLKEREASKQFACTTSDALVPLSTNSLAIYHVDLVPDSYIASQNNQL